MALSLEAESLVSGELCSEPISVDNCCVFQKKSKSNRKRKKKNGAKTRIEINLFTIANAEMMTKQYIVKNENENFLLMLIFRSFNNV